MIVIGIYYALPWLRWHRGPDLPDQAVLLDMANNRFFFFFLEIWPQEFYFITGLLVLAALALFLVTSAAGRVWCGYTCPQTVDRSHGRRALLAGRPQRAHRSRGAVGSGQDIQEGHDAPVVLAIGLATGGAFVFYSAMRRRWPASSRVLPRRRLPVHRHFHAHDLCSAASPGAVHLYVPLARIQAMIDHETLLVSYKPHGRAARAAQRASLGGRGDCIDCKACVWSARPHDIRDGSQLECIQCALGIDACDDIRARLAGRAA